MTHKEQQAIADLLLSCFSARGYARERNRPGGVQHGRAEGRGYTDAERTAPCPTARSTLWCSPR